MSLIEKPYEGRATLEDTMLGSCKISIPAPRKWLTVIFLCFWLCGWAFGEVFALIGVIGGLGSGAPQLFLAFWLCGWTVGGTFAISTVVWALRGMEIVTIGQGELSIEKKGALFFKARSYDLNSIQNFRVEEAPADSRSNSSFSDMYGVGTIRFDYGMKTIKFGAGLDEAEAKFILKKLAAQRLIKYPA